MSGTRLSDIPRAALWLGLAGLLPFIWGALTVVLPSFGLAAMDLVGGRFIGPYVQLQYGAVILSFMSGVLWGFAARAEGPAMGYGFALSVLPAIWAFVMTGGGVVAASINLIVGFVGVLMLDWQFARQGLTPPWWMTLRILLTGIVVLCLSVTVI